MSGTIQSFFKVSYEMKIISSFCFYERNDELTFHNELSSIISSLIKLGSLMNIFTSHNSLCDLQPLLDLQSAQVECN